MERVGEGSTSAGHAKNLPLRGHVANDFAATSWSGRARAHAMSGRGALASTKTHEDPCSAVHTVYFNEWIVIEPGNPDWYVGLMSLCVSVALLLALPLLGQLADRTRRRKPLLVGFTLACVTLTALERGESDD